VSVCVIRRTSHVADMSLNLAVRSPSRQVLRRIDRAANATKRERTLIYTLIYSTNSIDRALTSGLHRADRKTSRAARYFLRNSQQRI